MIGVKSHLEKASGAVARNEAATSRWEAALADHDKRRPCGEAAEDADALYEWRRDRRDIEDRHAAALEALSLSQQALQRAQVDEAERARKTKHAEMVREAEVAKKLFRDIFDLQQKLAPKLIAAEAHVEKFADYNKDERPRELPFVPDAEYLLRYKPTKEVPAVFEEVEVWVNSQGREPVEYVLAPNGKDMIPENRFEYNRKMKKQVCRSGARTITGGMPERVTSAVKLIDIDGGRLWN